MKTKAMFWNQLKWDLRFVWWAFAALLVLAPLLVWSEMGALRDDSEQQQMVLSIAVWALMMLVAGVGVVLVIQKEVPFGQKEFWLTRPVSRGVVLSSKLVVLGLFLLLLGVSWVMTPLLTGSGEWLWMFGINFLVAWAWMLVVAAVLASLSASLMRMFINAAILAAVVVGALLLKEVLFPRVFRYREANQALEMGWIALLPLLLAVGGLGVVAWQYFARRPWIGMGAFAALLVAAFLSLDKGYQFAGFENLVSRGLEGEEGWDEMAFKLQWDEPEIGQKPEVGFANIRGERYCQFECSGLFDNVPLSGFVEDVLFQGDVSVDGVVVWKNNPSWGRFSKGQLPLPTELGEYRSLRQESRGDDLNAGKSSFSRRLKVASVPIKEVEKWRSQSVSYSGKARFYVEDVVPLAVVPFGEDFTVKSRGMRLRGKVSSRQNGQEGFFVTIDGSNLITFPFEEPLDRDGLGVFLVNSEQGEFLRLGGGGGSSGNAVRILFQESNFGLYHPEEVFASEAEREAWLAGCEIRIYARERKGSFVRSVELGEIPLKKLMRSRK